MFFMFVKCKFTVRSKHVSVMTTLGEIAMVMNVAMLMYLFLVK